MQDIHSIGNVGGRLFGGGGAGDRRVRQHHQQNQQALKCPRCDSLNTKFCYYNNYNLSQPRHFCKSCRRYWTKGGVLRNVPVGGGCRKTKRSKLKQTATDHNMNSTAGPTTSTIVAKQQQEEEIKTSNSRSSSESSSLTAANAATGLEAVSTTRNGIGESKLVVHHQNMNTSYDHGLLEHGSDCGIFSEIGNFTNLINCTSDHLPFGFGNMMNQQQGLEHVQQNQNSEQQREKKGMEDIAGGLNNDQTVHVELSALQSSHASENNAGSCFGALDWQGGVGGLFDLPNAVDQTYWSQSEWTDQDHHALYLP